MNSTVVVPRIIHQTWKTADVPDIWHHARKRVSVRLHASCSHLLVSDASMRTMSSEHMLSVSLHLLNAGMHVLRRECQRLHPGYEFKLWTDASAREMIAKDYPEYLTLYDGYKYNIQVSSIVMRCDRLSSLASSLWLLRPAQRTLWFKGIPNSAGGSGVSEGINAADVQR
jgi:mannosyltransferase OCH1-like enzyme